MTNIARFLSQLRKQTGKGKLGENEVLLMTNDDYAQEHQAMLDNNGYYGFENPERVRFFKQPLGAKYIASVETVKNAEKDLRKRREYSEGDDFILAMAYSANMENEIVENPEAVLSDERDPLGHGEYFHQMIEN